MTGKEIMQSEPDDGETATLPVERLEAVGKPAEGWRSWGGWLREDGLLENLTRILQRLVFIAAAVFAVFEYAQDRQNGIEQEAFELVNVWETAEYQSAYQAIRGALSFGAETLGNPSEKRLSKPQVAILHANIGWASLETSAAAASLRALDRLVYFGNRVGYCESRGLCDHATLVEFFGDALDSLRSYYAGYIVHKRTTESPAYGEYLDRFLQNAGYDPDAADSLLDPPSAETIARLRALKRT